MNAAELFGFLTVVCISIGVLIGLIILWLGASHQAWLDSKIKVKCTYCSGTGALRHNTSAIVCPNCNGKGHTLL
jgi:hypothetical protein